MKALLNQTYKNFIRTAVFAIAIAASTLLVAQEVVEEVLVTGSFISRPADRPQPVSVLNLEEIQANQRITLTEVVRDMPQIASANVTANSLNPTNSIDLRGLGERSTLILLNGQRQTVDANANGAVDVNNLAPGIMIERLELVLDGSSALYGSDAVAGVANFITRNNFEGAEMQISSQVAEAQSDVPEFSMSAIFGSQGERTGIVTALEYQSRDDVMEVEDIRDRARIEKGLPTAFYNPGTFVAGDGSFHPDPLCGSDLIGGDGSGRISNPAGAVIGPFCRGMLTLQRTLIPETKTLTGMSVVTYVPEADWFDKVGVEMSFAKATMKRHEGTGLPFLALGPNNFFLPASNPGVIDANQRDPNFPLQDYVDIFSRQQSPVEGPVVQSTKQFTYRAALNLEGTLANNNWDWRVSGSFSQNNEESQDVDTIAERFAAAVQGFGGGDCKWNPALGPAASGLQPGVGNCKYWNPFASRLIAQPGDPTYNDPALLEWMQWGESPTSESKLYTLEALITGDLWEMPGGTAALAIGAQYRRQKLDFYVDPIQKDGGFGFAPQVLNDWHSDRDTNALFSELVIYPFEDVELDIAARYEETLGESSVDPKISVLWTPTDNLYLRASAGSSFRQPSEDQMFGVGEGLGSVLNLGGEVTQARGMTTGNPDLEPEESDNWTIGATWDITDNLTVEATWWDYEFTNLVANTSADAILRADMADGFLDNMEAHPLFPGAPNEVCEVTGRWDPESGDPLPADCVDGFDISIFNITWINQDSVETNGLDLTLDWQSELFGGTFGATWVTTYVHSYKGTDINGDVVDVVGTDGFNVAGIEDNPDIRSSLILSFSHGNHSLRTATRYTSGIEITNPDAEVQLGSEASYTQLDFSYNYRLPTEKPTTFTLSVLNAGDREPPLVADGLLTSNAFLFDPRGRMWRASLNFGF